MVSLTPFEPYIVVFRTIRVVLLLIVNQNVPYIHQEYKMQFGKVLTLIFIFSKWLKYS